jgi:alpha-glucosidase
LVALFDCDRASLLTELIVGVIGEFGMDTSQMHNDSTSVSVHGAYESADGAPRRGKATPAVTFGHSKDHRPDLKQLVWILTVSADGSVPMAYRLADGNTCDDPTHIPTWDALVRVLGRRDFLYVADSKLCSGDAMRASLMLAAPAAGAGSRGHPEDFMAAQARALVPGPGPRPWWRDAVVYEIYVRSFQDGNADGIGDLAGVRARLAYLAELGVDAVWLTPFFCSPGRDHGYDISDYTDVDPLLGTLAEVEGLIRDAHAAGLRILIDFVPNHSSDQHPWFLDARSCRSSTHRHWYTWADPAPDWSPPNNWLSVFGGPAWTFDPTTGQYYLHSIMPGMPDLNWRHPPVAQAMFDVVRFWLDRGVDGLRIDCAHYLMKDPQLRDNPPAGPGALAFHRPMGAYDTQLHLYDKGHPDIHQLYRRLRGLLDGYGTGQDEKVSVGEVHVFDLPEWASYYGRDLDEMHLPFNFGLLTVPWRAPAIAELIERIETVLPAGAWPNWVLGNHDEARVASRVGRQQARVAMMLLLTLRGTPILFQGDELGLPDAAPIPGGEDPWGRTDPALSRDRARAPMPWTAGAHRGFTASPTGAWLPTYRQPGLDAQNQTGQPDSMLELTRRLLRPRRNSPALRSGDITLLTNMPADVLGYQRTSPGEQLLILLNLGTTQHRLATPTRAHLAISTHPEPPALTDGRITLRADEGVILRASGDFVIDTPVTRQEGS